MHIKSFTLIELILIIVILAVMAVIAVAKYIDIREKALIAAENKIIATVKTAIENYYANSCMQGNCHYPSYLENIAGGGGKCSATKPCFTAVLSPPLIDDTWCNVVAAADYIYKSPRKRYYSYVPGGGDFYDLCASGYVPCPPWSESAEGCQ